MSWIETTGFRKILGMNQDTKLKVVYGGASASKTYSIIPILINKAIENPNERITIVSDSSRNVNDGAAADFEQIMKDFGLWQREQFTKNPSKYMFKNGSMIEFLGADEADKFRGPRRDRLYVNEANRVSFETFLQMKLRTRKEIYIDYNPVARFWYHEQIEGQEPHETLKLTYLDNESLNESDIGEFNNMKKRASTGDEYWVNRWRVYGQGLTGRIEGACIKTFKTCYKDHEGTFWKDSNFTDPIEGYQKLDIGLDFGDVDPNAGVQLYSNDSRTSFILDEILYKSDIELSDIYNSLKDHDSVIYADYNFPHSIKYLRAKGLTIHKCRKGPDSIKNGINLINELDVYVTSDSPNLIHEFQSYSYKTDKDGNKVDGKYTGPDHLVDACRYVLTKNIKKRQTRLIQF